MTRTLFVFLLSLASPSAFACFMAVEGDEELEPPALVDLMDEIDAAAPVLPADTAPAPAAPPVTGDGETPTAPPQS